MRFTSTLSLIVVFAISSIDVHATATVPATTPPVTPNPTDIKDAEFLAMGREGEAAYLQAGRQEDIRHVDALTQFNDDDFDASIKAAKCDRGCSRFFHWMWT